MIVYANPLGQRAPANAEDSPLPMSYPTVARHKITAAFQGVRNSFIGDVILSTMVDRRVGRLSRGSPVRQLLGAMAPLGS